MNKKLNMVISAQLLAIAGVLIIASPANSQDFTDFLRNAFANNRNSQYKQNYLNATMIQTMNSYNSKRVDLENQISMALGKNQITQQQANNWRSQMSANADLQNSFTGDGNFTFVEAQNVLDRLNSIENEVNAAVNLATTNQNYRGSNWFNGRYNQFPRSQNSRSSGNWNDERNINLAEREILNKLQKAHTNRLLSNRDYNNFKRQYDGIVRSKTGAGNHRGRLSSQESSDFLNRLNNLNNSITQHLHNRRISGR